MDGRSAASGCTPKSRRRARGGRVAWTLTLILTSQMAKQRRRRGAHRRAFSGIEAHVEVAAAGVKAHVGVRAAGVKARTGAQGGHPFSARARAYASSPAFCASLCACACAHACANLDEGAGACTMSGDRRAGAVRPRAGSAARAHTPPSAPSAPPSAPDAPAPCAPPPAPSRAGPGLGGF